jgi:hypothetical protein
MAKAPPKPRDTPSRRSFFSIASVAVAPAVLGSAAGSAEASPAPDRDEREPVYRETPHITAFYHRSRF